VLIKNKFLTHFFSLLKFVILYSMQVLRGKIKEVIISQNN